MKNIVRKGIIGALMIFGLLSCQSSSTSEEVPVKVAFLADVHLQDLYGELSDSDYRGVFNSSDSTYVMARTMKAQLNSTRLFNENYFAFLAALDDVVERGIKYVVLPGDFSDDGQPFNLRGLKRILDTYTEVYGLRFILTTGNHDPVRPFAMDAGKKDFLGVDGKAQPIMSKEGLYTAKSESEWATVISKDFGKMGYEVIITSLQEFGFAPNGSDVYWETPFSDYTYDDYTYAKALEGSVLANRYYQVNTSDIYLPDVSYLVEPEEGVWFLAIDGNVYVPNDKAEAHPEHASSYGGASVGYNGLLSHKQHILPWVASVTKRAEQLGKKLIVFSHYPMIDFNDDASDYIRDLLGEGKMQLHRIPDESIAKLFAEAGVKVHFGGHMHINDTGVRKYDNNMGLVNIQTPSLAAYIPAYKIAEVTSDAVHVQTVVLDSVANFDALFPLYKMEHDFLESIDADNIWNEDVLTASTYHEFTNWHLKELVRLRFLKKDWPADFKDRLLNLNGKELGISIGMEASSLDGFEQWTGFDMVYDFYRLRSADKLAIRDISVERIQEYESIIAFLLKGDVLAEEVTFKTDLVNFAQVFHRFLNGAPANHFSIDLNTLEIHDLDVR